MATTRRFLAFSVIALVLAGQSFAAPGGRGADCTSADGITIHSGQAVAPAEQGNSGHVMSIFFACRDGKWLFNGVTPVAAPTFGNNYTVVTR